MYSAEDVAGMLGLHVRTVRSYVRDGRLPAVRIGKQYRIADYDLRRFMGRPAEPDPAVPARVEVTSVVDIEVDRTLMNRLTTLVVAAANTAPGDRARLTVQTSYDEIRQTLKIVIIGDPDDTAHTLTLISALVQDADS
jgi:excisionase family DNA binding protein